MSERETSGNRREHGSVLSDAQRRELRGIAQRIRASIPSIEGDRRLLREVLRELRDEISPRSKGGRPPSRAVTTAIAMRTAGTTWPRVYEACIDGFRGLRPAERREKADQLRAAVRARKRRTNPAANVPPTNIQAGLSTPQSKPEA